jgi:hypothetical protein
MLVPAFIQQTACRSQPHCPMPPVPHGLGLVGACWRPLTPFGPRLSWGPDGHVRCLFPAVVLGDSSVIHPTVVTYATRASLRLEFAAAAQVMTWADGTMHRFIFIGIVQCCLDSVPPIIFGYWGIICKIYPHWYSKLVVRSKQSCVHLKVLPPLDDQVHSGKAVLGQNELDIGVCQCHRIITLRRPCSGQCKPCKPCKPCIGMGLVDIQLAIDEAHSALARTPAIASKDAAPTRRRRHCTQWAGSAF